MNQEKRLADSQVMPFEMIDLVSFNLYGNLRDMSTADLRNMMSQVNFHSEIELQRFTPLINIEGFTVG